MNNTQTRPDDLPTASPAPGRLPGSRWSPRVGQQLRFAAASMAALAVFVGTYILIVGTEPGQRIENLALRGAELRGPNDRQAAVDVLSVVTAGVFGLSTAAVFVAGLILRRPGLGCVAVAVMVLSVAGAELLKAMLVRPDLVPGPAWLLRNSFPSGTATVATSMAVGAFMIAPNRLRWVFLPVGALFAGIVAHAVQASGWHRLSDTIGAAALVICIACIGVACIASAGLVSPSKGGMIDGRVKRMLLLGSIATLVVGTMLLVLPAAFPLLAAPDGSRRAFLQVAFPLVGGSLTVLLVTLFGLLVEPFALGRSGRHADEPAVRDPSALRRNEPAAPSQGAGAPREAKREDESATPGGSRPVT